jgi:hypothetical protein
MEESMFTPCFEDTRDVPGTVALGPPVVLTTGLSAQSQARALNQLRDGSNGAIRHHSKNIYLGDLFDSLRIPAAFFLQNMQLRIRPKTATDILMFDPILMTHYGKLASNIRYYVTGIRLYITMVNLTENQLSLEREKILTNESILRTSFYSFDALQKSHSQGASYRDSNVKNLQAAVMMFPSSLCADGIGVNRYQYTYGSTVTNNLNTGGLTSYQMRYDNIYFPSSQQSVSLTAMGENTELFSHYRLLCKKMFDREITPALRFSNFAPIRDDVVDRSTYAIFCAQFYPQESYGHKTMAGSDHEILTSGGGNETLLIVRIRLSFLEIRGDTSVYMIN